MEKYVAADDGRVVIDLERVAEVHVWLVGGDVSIGGTAAPPRLEVECQRGDPVRVADEAGRSIQAQGGASVHRARGLNTLALRTTTMRPGLAPGRATASSPVHVPTSGGVYPRRPDRIASTCHERHSAAGSRHPRVVE